MIAELGGLHAFSGWDGPILTDSGGFQVFSLRDTLLDVDDDGVTFRSVYDGAAARFSPEVAARIQRNLGSDIAMASTSARRRACREPSSRRPCGCTTLWAARQREAERAPGQLLFGIAQGAADPELRRRSIEEIAALGFDGHALGGPRGRGEPRGDVRGDRLGGAAPARGASRATSWGSATPRGSCA